MKVPLVFNESIGKESPQKYKSTDGKYFHDFQNNFG